MGNKRREEGAEGRGSIHAEHLHVHSRTRHLDGAVVTAGGRVFAGAVAVGYEAMGVLPSGKISDTVGGFEILSSATVQSFVTMGVISDLQTRAVKVVET